jgi:checkpoint serine/threonine-protein kinase
VREIRECWARTLGMVWVSFLFHRHRSRLCRQRTDLVHHLTDTNPSSKPKALSPPPALPASYAPKPRTSLDQMPPPPTPLQRIPEPQPLPTPTPSSSMPPPPLPVQTPSHPRPAQPAQTPQAAAPEPTPKARRPSPTINTKAALADVMDMYNAGAGEDDEDEDDSDDSDDDDDFPPIVHIPETPVPPTPVPQVAQRLFQLPSVPPPTSNEDVFRDEPTAPVFRDDNTPSSSRQLQHKPASPAIFQDENAVPSSSRQAFGTTPQSRPPLSARKPSFEIFSDDAPASSAPPPPSATKTPFGEKTLAPLRETFATPMPESKQLRRGVGFASQPMTEEDEEEGDQAERLEEEEDEREYERSRGVWDGRVGAFELMTPITERTSEYARSSIGGATARSSIGGATARSSMGGLGISEEDEEEGENATPLAAGNQGIFVDPPQDSVPSKMLDRLSIRDEDVAEDRDSFNRSSSVPFSVSDGYTIEGQTGQTASLMDTMNVVDPTSNEAPLSPPQPAEPTAAPYQPTPPRAPLPLPTHVVASPIRPSVAKAINFHSASPPSASTPPSGSNVPISIANPCNPMDPETMDLLIAALSPPLSDLPGFRDLTTKTSNLLDGLQKSAKAKVRRGSTGSSKSGAGGDRGMGEGLGTVDLGGVAFEVREKIGEGGFGAVFLARDVAADAAGRKKNGSDAGSDEEDEDEDGSDDEDEGASSLVALKIEKPAGIWEGLILDRVHSRLPSSLQSSIISSKGLYAFADESFLILSYSSQGTLLDAVNQASKLGIASSGAGGPAGMDELVVLFFTVELLRAVEALHRAHFIHGDLKIDNCLVRLDPIPGGPSSWSSQYDKEGGGGWASKGIKMIDFGKAIDMSLFPQEQTFIADWAVDARDCVEMREARPWSYQTDYFGLASICYCMLFGSSCYSLLPNFFSPHVDISTLFSPCFLGKYIETAVTPSEPGSIGKRYKIATPLKRVRFPFSRQALRPTSLHLHLEAPPPSSSYPSTYLSPFSLPTFLH